jgi:hypothetical protein
MLTTGLELACNYFATMVPLPCNDGIAWVLSGRLVGGWGQALAFQNCHQRLRREGFFHSS